METIPITGKRVHDARLVAGLYEQLFDNFLKLRARHSHAAVHQIATECSGDHDSSILTRLDCRNFRLNHGGCHADTAKIISREFQDSNRGTEKILLISNALIGRDKKIELPSQPTPVVRRSLCPSTPVSGR
jgi:hypothetical protein